MHVSIYIDSSHPPKARCRLSLSREAAASSELLAAQNRPTKVHTSHDSPTTLSTYTPTPYPEQSHTAVDTMAAAIKALNAKIRANPVADYFCSTR